jgi:phage tail P2-like protein
MASTPPNALLPPNATALEIALAQTMAAQIGALQAPLRVLWNPASCPLALLPWLAATLAVENWDSSWPETVKRARIASATAIHRHKGTVRAVQDIIAAYGGTASLTLWHETTPPGAPYTFTLSIALNTIDGAAPGADYIDGLINDVTRAKGARDTFTFQIANNGVADLGLFAVARPAIYARLECAAVNA